MSIRVGESWTARNGHRRWVSMNLGTYLFGRGIWGLMVFPFVLFWWLLLAELWALTEFLLLVITGVVVLVALARREVKPSAVTVVPLRWGLVMFDLKGARP